MNRHARRVSSKQFSGLCTEHASRVVEGLAAAGYPVGHKNQEDLLDGAQVVIRAQAGNVSRPKVLECMAARDGTPESCVICKIGEPDWPTMAVSDAVETFKRLGVDLA